MSMEEDFSPGIVLTYAVLEVEPFVVQNKFIQASSRKGISSFSFTSYVEMHCFWNCTKWTAVSEN